VPRPLTPLALVMGYRYAVYADGPNAGEEITRVRTCGCGQSFTQRMLAPSELAALERMGHLASVTAQIPGYFVPVHCPPCERADIGRQAYIDEGRALSLARGTASATVPDRRAS
jgi:hypothetical protein